jgi:hypothetical protein
VGIDIDVIDPMRVERARTPDDPVDLIAFAEQQFSEIRAVLAGNTSDKRFFHSQNLESKK